ncbi:MAG: tRNA (adenosine(37)-N6)-threonylcarbamoyltransferase complex ATPase subunit type 1 TsaE [Planctomycetes bacterium]|nr:tRNA (adenosine(37)-N6)-threonylcarbamoyltransferase complex ATPase subunit type 1 TsaE [Planctomycetota bacterium]
MTSLELITQSPEATRALGRRLGELCVGGEVVLLHGNLGAGKTVFAQGLALGLGVSPEEPVVSPTFLIHIQYQARLTFNHIDAYRLLGKADTSFLAIDELIDNQGVMAVEWAEYLGNDIPHKRLEVTLQLCGEDSRLLRLEPRPAADQHYTALLDALAEHHP